MAKLYTASTLVNFYNCKYLTYLEDLKQGNPEEKNKISFDSLFVIERGNQHEINYLNYLQHVEKKSVVNLQELTQGKSLSQSFEITKQVLKEERPDVIFQATLMNSQWLGKADFLCKNPKTNQYDIVDTKVSRYPKATHLLQIGLYHELLNQITFETKTPISQNLILVSPASLFYQADRPFTEHHYQYKNIKYYLNNIKRSFFEFLNQDANEIQVSPEYNNLCPFCQWNQHCTKVWQEKLDLHLIADMNPSHRQSLKQDGISNLTQLIDYKYIHATEADNYKNQLALSEDYFNRYQRMAKVYLKSLDTKKPQFQPNKDYIEELGYMRLPKVSERDIYLDILDDPTNPDHPIRVFYVQYSTANFETMHIPFTSTDFDNELQAFQQFFDFIESYITEPIDIKAVSEKENHSNQLNYKIIGKIYYFNDRLMNAMMKLAERHQINLDKLDLFKKHAFIDLKQIAKECMYISQPSYDLYDLQIYVQPHEQPLQHNGTILANYETFLISADPQDLLCVYDELKRHVETIEQLHCWILNCRPDYEVEAKPQKLRKKSVAELTAKLDYKAYHKIFDKDFKILADLLNFYEREAIPSELKSMQRQLASVVELIRDSECLAGLKLTQTMPNKANPSETIYIYDFPPQDSRVKKDSDDYIDVNTGQKVGVIAKIDLQKCKVAIRSVTSLPESLSLIPNNKIYTNLLEDALGRYATYQTQSKLQDHSESHQKYQAITSILRKEFPKVQGIQYGERISFLDEIEDTPQDDRSRHIVLTTVNLNHSYLVIQGAPGAGKTHVASRIINNLILRKKRIGVTSNSHKAINNLLEGIEKRANELVNDKKISVVEIKGIKLSSKRDEGSRFNTGQYIADTTDSKQVFNHFERYNLFAGTAWFFARTHFDDDPVDYLFVDEAGQVSLAHLIAMGTGAKNIILLGDQMQLSQPIQGEHPNDAGKSVLEYLLEDEPVISNRKGFFLGKTYRMHPKITEFISDAVYDGGLSHDQRTEKQKIILDENLLQQLNYKEAGIVFMPIDHQNCIQNSIEEAEFIQKLYHEFLKQSYIDQYGKTQAITHADIMIVTPYNLQVNLLKTYLPEAEIGTVDKFQGKEAHIVIISMVTSNSDLTNDFEFLYSKNRLNVAISRAKSLAILVANPQLKFAKCENSMQLELVNTLCWLMER